MHDADRSRDLAEIVADIRDQVPPGARIAFVSGLFNVLHPGHVRLLKFAAECSDFLVVGVLERIADPGGDPRHEAADAASTVHERFLLPSDMRLEGMRAIAMVDYCFLLRVPPVVLIGALRPDIVLKGKEFEALDNPEAEAVAAYGGKLSFSSGEMSFASFDLLERQYAGINGSSIAKPRDYPARHGFSVAGLIPALAKLAAMKVLVIGDLIVDEYIDCDALGMSQEDPTIVVRPIARKRFIGGSGIVAAHAAKLGAGVHYLSVAGDDAIADYGRAGLDALGIATTIIEDPSRPTTLKMRYRAGGKTLLRVSELRQHAISAEIAERIYRAAEEQIAGADLLVFSDFNYGCLPQALVDRLITLGRDAGVAMVADSQASSQVADIGRFKDMLLITPTEREARLALHDWDSGLAEIASSLQMAARSTHVVITLGAEGILVLAKENGTYILDRLPALNSAPKDVAGAGDSFLISAAMALCAGMDIWQAAYLGAIVAACQVGRVGNTPLRIEEIVQELERP